MQIEANALRRLQQYFRNIDWCEGVNTRAEDISEEVLISLFRELGAPESDVIRLNDYHENELAAFFSRPGFIDISVSVEGFDDVYKFYHHFSSEPDIYYTSHTEEITFNELRKYKSFKYDPSSMKWKLKFTK